MSSQGLGSLHFDGGAVAGLRHWKLISLLFSCAYLVFELSFSARLLDAVGAPGRTDVRTIEWWGRILSGLALAIVFWSAVLLPRLSKGLFTWSQAMPYIAVSGLFIIAIVWISQEILIKSIVKSSTPEQRQAAVMLNSVSAAVVDGQVSLRDIDVNSELLSSPEGKAMLAFLPFSGSRLTDIATRAEPVVRQVIVSRVDAQMGSPEEFWEKVWRPSAQAIVRRWNEEYVPAQERRERAIADIPRQQNRLWNDYVTGLQARGFRDLRNIPSSQHFQIRSELRRRGVPVGDNWHPSDEAGFRQALDRRIRQDVDAEWNRGFTGRDVPVLPPDLQADQFFSQAVVQEEWRSALGLQGTPVLHPRMTYPVWLDRVWNRERTQAIQEQTNRVLAASSKFGEGQELESFGRSAVEAAIVPPIALVFSLIGAATHIGKVLASLVALLPRIPRFAPPVVWLASVVSLVMLPMGRTNIVLASGMYAGMKQAAETGWGTVPTGVMTWVLQAQPLAYPVGDTLRRYVLFGLSFGVSDAAIGPGSRPAPDRVVTEQPPPSPPAQPAARERWVEGPQQCGGVPVLAHRGARPHVENTLPAIQAARAAGFTASEIDIQMTREGNWVLHHDVRTGRVVVVPNSLVPPPVSQITLAQWNEAHLMQRESGRVVRVPGSTATLLGTVNDAIAAGGRLEIEVKAEAQCHDIARAMMLTDRLGRNVRWTSAYRGSLNCLINAHRNRLPGSSEGYVGLIVGPPQSSIAARYPDSTGASAFMSRFSANPTARWDEVAHRNIATPDGLRTAAAWLADAPKRGVHLPATDLDRYPNLPRVARELRLGLTLYADLDDAHLARVVRAMDPQDRRDLDALVIDGALAPFCAAAFVR